MAKRDYIKVRLPKEDMKQLRMLVRKGMFRNAPEACKIAVSRFLKELETYKKKKTLEKLEMLGKGSRKKEREVEKEMKDLVKFIDDLY